MEQAFRRLRYNVLPATSKGEWILAYPKGAGVYSLFVLVFLSALGVQRTAAEEPVLSVPGEVLVGVRVDRENDLTPVRLADVVGEAIGYQETLHAYRLRLRPGLSIQSAIDLLSRRADVLYVEPNHILHAYSTPNDTYYGSQYGPQKVQADLAWGIWNPQAQVIVAVVDTGIDNTHPDLTNKILRDATGIVGYDAFTGTRSDASDGYGHGTHCAGIAAAQINNGGGIAGIAGWNGAAGASDANYTKLMPVKVLDSNGSGTDATVADGITWAANHGARVISLSLGGGSSTTLSNAVQYAWSQGCVVVAAAGNSGSATPSYPAGYANVISVAATDSNDKLTSFSNYGASVSVAAPGNSILSTTPTYSAGGGFPLNYAYLSGTSMACPHVAGEAALLLSQNPALTNAQVRDLITTNVDPYTPYSGGIATGAGRINVYRALQAVTASPPPTNPTTSATFVKTDTSTRGSWKGVYGTDGYQVIGDTTSLPAYAALGTSGQSAYTWASSTSDPSALQKASSTTDRIAACHYGTTYSYDLNLTDGLSHQTAFYFLDWDGANGRSERIDIYDAVTNALLDSQSVASFSGGKYFVWNFKGHVKIKVTSTGAANGVVSGIFFAAGATGSPQAPTAPTNVSATAGNQAVTLSWTAVSGAATYNVYRATVAGGEGSSPYKTGLTTASFTDTGLTNGTTYFYKVSAVDSTAESAPSSEVSATPTAPVTSVTSATFVKTDATTQGTWQGVYGASGYQVLGDTTSLPAYAALSVSGQSAYTWVPSTSDPRALQKANSATDRIASCYYTGSSFTFDLNLTDGLSHQTAFYFLDWDGANGRSERIDIYDAVTNVLLDSQSVASFSGGKYLIWNFKGHVKIKVTSTGAANGVVSGVFFQ
jgi:thermitase